MCRRRLTSMLREGLIEDAVAVVVVVDSVEGEDQGEELLMPLQRQRLRSRIQS